MMTFMQAKSLEIKNLTEAWGNLGLDQSVYVCELWYIPAQLNGIKIDRSRIISLYSAFVPVVLVVFNQSLKEKILQKRKKKKSTYKTSKLSESFIWLGARVW